MKSIAIKGSKRESVGKRATRALRDAEKVPCVLYGGAAGVIHFSAPEKDFRNLVYTPDVHTVKLDVEGKKVNAVLQDIQFHPVTDRILHMDFFQFDDENPITMTLPVHAEGIAKGTREGGVLQMIMRRIDVTGLVSKIPDYIEVDVTNLGIGDAITIEDLKEEGIEFPYEDDDPICHVIAPRSLETLLTPDDGEAAEGEETEGATEGEEAAETKAEEEN